MDNRFECGCERGGDCTKTTMCQVQDMADEIERLNGLVALQKKDMKVAMDRVAELEALLADPVRLRKYIENKMDAETAAEQALGGDDE